MEIADRKLPLCPECIAMVATGGEEAALARAFLAASGIPTIH
jgi:hypothetical protein